jgi:serine/threonine protein kinase
MEHMKIQSESIDWCKRAGDFIPDSRSCTVFRILEDTTDFYQVNYGDVLLLNGVGYLVRGTESEKKFGLEGEPKPWVKSCVDLVTAARKIVKLTFFEEFACRIEGMKFTCLRNPEKEARILDKIKGHEGFMQGFHVYDAAGNNVRVLDRISGTSLDTRVRSIPTDHETYYRNHLPAILDGLLYAFESMAELHELGEIHGDITPDHIYVETETGRYRWIDFDYDYKEQADLVIRDVFEMGTLLGFVVGKDYVAYADLKTRYPKIAAEITPGDMQSVFPNQLANLKLLYPHIDDALNAILLRFSEGSAERYSNAAELAADLREALAQVKNS